jgi:hypothetical protein
MRSPAPHRTLFALAALLAAVSVRAGDPAAATASASATAPAKAQRVPIVLAAPKDLKEAVRSVALATDAETEKLEGVAVDEGRSFSMSAAAAERLLEGSHAAFRSAGYFLFRYERSYGVGGEKDRVGLIKTVDRGVVLRSMRTSSAKHGLTTDALARWLDALQKDEPFDLWEIGADYVAGRFERTPKDPLAVAKRCAAIAPDLVAGRATTLQLLANEIRDNRTLLLIW